MIKRISTIFLVLVVIGLALNFTFKTGGDRKTVQYPSTVIDGSEVSVKQSGPVVNFDANNFEPIYYSDSVLSIVDVRTGPETIYDLQSNGVPQQVWQDPNTPSNIHAVFTVNLTPTWPAADRRVYYAFSSDYGATWTDYGPNPTTGSNGFGFCSGLSDGSAIIGGHTDNGGGPVRLQVFADVAPGAGTFTRLDPGQFPIGGLQVIWGRIQPTTNITNTTKFVVMGSVNSTALDTVTVYNRGLDLSASSYSGYVRDMNIGNAEVYSFSRGSDGRIGLAYVANDNVVLSNSGKAYYMYSTDDGATWSTPVLIWDPPAYLDGIYGVMRGITLTYVGTTPKVAFELVGLTTTGYYPSGKAGIGFWAPDVNGGVAVQTPFDSTWSNNGNGGATDVMASISRPSISRSIDGQLLMMAFLVSRADTDAIGSHFYDVYMTTSSNGGTNWKFPPTRLTNNSGPLRDNRFANLSPTNDITGGFYYANLVYQQDSIPGSVTQTPPAAESLAKQRFMRIKFDPSTIGINTISTEIPAKFNLEQNYPNPFNPVTKIRFSVPKSANITLEVYDVTGRLVSTLVKNEAVTAGLKEVDFNAVNLPSGIYFYTLKTADFTETKKMVLVK
ncbi:MAG TPA: T9SS type A sorting domain-containing protein [Ignavibacteria bacterium]|nr:T9SS type A sorting domain-containing protein [Ignavibacteria bacterium]HMQ97966.1 T9SS type A sorting domain-containing protein [Ignavibacteria bacterium]